MTFSLRMSIEGMKTRLLAPEIFEELSLPLQFFQLRQLSVRETLLFSAHWVSFGQLSTAIRSKFSR